MNKHYDVIIVGGGVIGSSIAFHLSKQKRKVLMLEKGQLAGKASGAAAGMIGAQAERNKDSPLFRHARKSRAMFPLLAQELKELSGIDIQLAQNGICKVAETDEEISSLKSVLSVQQNLREDASWISSSDLRTRESALSHHIKGAMYIPEDGNVSAPHLSKAFAYAAASLGTEVMERTEVHEILKEKNRVIGVQTSKGIFRADETIVAGGAWSKQLVNHMGIKLATYPVKGECFSVNLNVSPIKATIFASNCYIVPKSGGRLVIGATEKANSFDETVRLHGISKLMNAAVKLVPELKNARWEKAWAGIRPQTADGIPYMGRHPLFEGLSIATGHYRNGILLSPITGLYMAELMDGKDIDSIFQIERNALKEVRT